VPVEYLATTLPDEGWDVNMLEEACLEAARNATKQLFLEALKQKEKKVLAKVDGGKERQGKAVLNHQIRTNRLLQAETKATGE